MNSDAVSVREASYLAGVPIRAVNKAIDAAKLRRGAILGRRQRLVTRQGVLQLALERELDQRVASEVRPSIRAGLRRAIAKAGPRQEFEVRLGDSLVLLIEYKAIEQRIERRWRQLARAMEQIVEDPEIQAGVPTFKGTRVAVWPIIEALKGGEDETELLRHYPSLSREKLQAAKLYAEVRPRRGRPKLRLGRLRPKSTRIVPLPEV